MGELSKSDWEVLSPLLDQALERDPATREEWLEHLRAERPEDAARLEVLLDEHRILDAESFLSSDRPIAHHSTIAGQVVGAYTIVSPLGEGGMGEVWLAQRSDGRFEGLAAVKLLGASRLSRSTEQRFRREGTLLARLVHPHIAHLIDAGVSASGQPFLVIEYVDGKRIDVHCDEADLGVEARVRLFIDVLAAVAEAHRKLIVHRDIKPSNVLVRRDGVVKLLDFGIAKLLSDAQETEALTRDGANVLTPEYAAPEQLIGHEVTTATDIYSLGVLLFELLAGRRPFTPDERRAMSGMTIEAEPPKLSRHMAPSRVRWQGLVVGDLDNILAKAMRVDPAERYATVSAFSDDLQRHLADEPVTARVDTLTYRAGKFIRRHRGGVATAALTVIALVAATVITTLQSVEARHQRNEAQYQLRRAEASNDFVTSLLSQAGTSGRAFTPVELLDRGIEAIDAQYGSDPEFSIDMLLLLSGRYMDLGRTDKEYAALQKAEAIARRTGNAESLLKVHCNTIETELQVGMKQAAIERLAQARRMVAENPTIQPMTRANCLRQEAVVAASEGRIEDAIGYLERTKRLLEENDLVYGNEYSSLFSWLYSFNAEAGHPLIAHRYHEQEVALVERYRRERTEAGEMAYVELAASYLALGEVRTAVERFEERVSVDSALALHPIAAVTYANALNEIGRYDDALKLVDGAIAQSSAAHMEDYTFAAQVSRGWILVRARRLAEAQAFLEPLILRLGNETPHLVGALVNARLSRAQIRLQRAELEAAEADVDACLTLLDYPRVATGPGLGRALILRTRILTEAGHGADAVTAGLTAVEFTDKNVRESRLSANSGTARLALAKAQTLTGDFAAARSNLALAVEALTNGLGDEQPATQEATTLLASLKDHRQT